MVSKKPKKGKAKCPDLTLVGMPAHLVDKPKPRVVDDDDDDDDDDSDLEEVAPAKPITPDLPDRFEGSRFQSKFNWRDNDFTSFSIPAWCGKVCASSNEVRVLAQIAYTFRQGGSRLYEKDGYKWTYQRNKKLAKELPPMTEKQVKYAVQNLIKRGVLVECDEWMENNRMLRIDAAAIAKLEAEWMSKSGC